jgi:hypothetical protein
MTLGVGLGFSRHWLKWMSGIIILVDVVNPIIIAPVYKSAGSVSDDVTLCSPITYLNHATKRQELYLLYCNDFIVDSLQDILY